MKHIKLALFIGLLTLSVASRMSAVTVSVQPDTQTAAVGDNVSIDLVISGLSGYTPSTLGGFFFDLTYDPAVLSAASFSFGDKLNSVPGEPQQYSHLTTPGIIHVDEVSFESSLSQPDTFILGSLVFTGLTAGTSQISFVLADLSDGDGNAITGLEPLGGSITVGTAVPDTAATWSMLVFAALTLLAFRRMTVPVLAPAE